VRAAVLRQPTGTLSIEDVAVDQPGRNEVLVRTSAAGLCHSDLHYIKGDSPCEVPIVLGHEGAGVVEKVGTDVSYVKPGDHVVTFAVTFCGRCNFCLSGRLTLCDGGAAVVRERGEQPRLRLSNGDPCCQFVGLSAFGEEMLVHENALVRISPEIPLDKAAIMGCAGATGLGAVLRTAKVREGAHVAVIGCGGIGLNAIQGAVIAGANRIIAIDINDEKLERARVFGATDLVNSAAGSEHTVAAVAELLSAEGGVDYSFEAIGLKQTYELAFALLRRGGMAVAIGVLPGDTTVEFTGRDFLLEKVFTGSRMGSAQPRFDLPYYLDLYMQGRLKLDELVSDHISLDEINEGYARIGDGRVARSVIVFDA